MGRTQLRVGRVADAELDGDRPVALAGGPAMKRAAMHVAGQQNAVRSSPLHLGARQLRQALQDAPVVDGIMNFFRARPVTPLRQRLEQTDGRELIVMPIVSTLYSGLKMLTVVPGNAGSPLPVISGLFTLVDMDSGIVLATMDASELTAWRTAGVAAAAAARLARADARTLTLLGAGHLIPYLAAAHAAVRPIDRVIVWARRGDAAAAAAERVAGHLGLDGIAVEISTDIEMAVRSGDIVSAATRATTGLIEGQWLSPGAHVDLVGGYRPDMREIDDAGLLRSSVYVDDRHAVLREAGDLTDPISRGVVTPDMVRGDLADLALAQAGRSSDDEITLFKSVGVAASDLAVAILAWQRHVAAAS